MPFWRQIETGGDRSARLSREQRNSTPAMAAAAFLLWKPSFQAGNLFLGVASASQILAYGYRSNRGFVKIEHLAFKPEPIGFP
jgi:hypothetical protein